MSFAEGLREESERAWLPQSEQHAAAEKYTAVIMAEASTIVLLLIH